MVRPATGSRTQSRTSNGRTATGVASSFGAAGSLVVLLVWVYFSAQIFLLGAEFTWVYSHEYGSKAALPVQKPVAVVPTRSGGAASATDAKGDAP